MSEKVYLSFEFRSPKFENMAIDFTRGKILVGRSPVCDFVINDDRVSSFHALITFNNQGDLIIYDLESKNGIYFEDERVQAYKLEPGVRFAIADISLRVSVQGNLALALSRLQEQTRELQLSDIMGKTPPPPPPMHAVSKKKEVSYDSNEVLMFDDGWKRYQFYHQTDLSDLYYPLENKKIALDSLIFDDDLPTDNVERGGKELFGLEVIVSIGGVVIDLKNYELKKQTIYLSGENLEAAENEVFFPTISKGEKKKFLELSRDGISLSLDTEGHYHSFASDGKQITKSYLEKENQKSVKMAQGNIYCLTYENLQIFMRVKSISKGLRFAPVFGRDKSLLWQIMVGIAVAVAAAMTMSGIEIPVKKKIKREVAVIYKQTQNKVVVKKPDSGSPEQKKAPPKKKKQKKQPKKKPQKKRPTPKKVAKKTVKKPKFSFMKKTKFKSFASSTNVASSKSRSKSNKKIDFSKTADVNYADESVDTADFATGKESSKWNKKGLGGKGGYRAAAFSKKTVVLGAIDPEAIRKALARYLSQFRGCYQEELDLNSEDLEGIFDFQFRIGTNGRVTKSSLSAHGKNFSQNGINCMKRVLNKIKFPKPKGGGVVDIKQTFNFSSGGV